MKKLFMLLLGASVLLGSTTPLMAGSHKQRPVKNLKLDIPVLEFKSDRWEKTPDVAQNGEADWKNAVGRAKNVTLKEAMEIADSHPEITYFFFMKSRRMVLGHKPNLRVFRHGDAVFFTGEPTWGEAKDLADGYMKKPAAANYSCLLFS